MKIAFYSSQPLDDKKNWSGTMFKMYEQILNKGFEVVWIKEVELSGSELLRLNKREKNFNKFFKRGYNTHVNYLRAKIAAKKLKNALYLMRLIY